MSSGEVLDASAVLALLQCEPGSERVELVGSVMNSVSFAEAVQQSWSGAARSTLRCKS